MRLVIHSSYISRNLSFYQSFQIQCSIHQSAGQAIAVLSPFFPSIYSYFHPSNSTFIYPFICSFIHPSIHLVIYTHWIIHAFIYPSTLHSFHPSVHSSINLFISHLLIFPSNPTPSTSPSTHPHIRLSCYSFIHQSILFYLFIHLSKYPFVHPFIRPFIHHLISHPSSQWAVYIHQLVVRFQATHWLFVMFTLLWDM